MCKIIAAIISVLGAAGLAYLFGIAKERRSAKQEFAAAIAPVRERIETDKNPTAVRAETIGALTGPYHQFRFRVCKSRRAEVELAWKKYRDLSETDLAPRQLEWKDGPQLPMDGGYKEVRERIILALDRILKCTR